jgi:hypothetical protein
VGYLQTFFFHFSLYGEFIEEYIKPYNVYWGFFRGVKRQGCGIDHPPPSDTMVENG